MFSMLSNDEIHYLGNITNLSSANAFNFDRSTFLVCINSLPNDRILDWSKFKAFADNKNRLAIMMIFVFDRAEKNVGKGENAGYQHLLLFPQCFQKAFYSGSLKVGIMC